MLYETYLLIKHGNFSYGDIQIMPVYERKMMLDFLVDEAEERKKRNESPKETN
jgi:hypothetical protein